jgi:hypothetical protein
MRTIYRADRVRPAFCLVVGGLSVTSAWFNIATIEEPTALVFIGLLGGIFLGVGLCILPTRVAIDGSGLEKRAPFAGSFRASWDEIECWWVDRGCLDPETLPQACFRLRRRRRRGVVYAADVCRPGFDAFLEDVRAHVVDRETIEPIAAAGGGRDVGSADFLVGQRGRRGSA